MTGESERQASAVQCAMCNVIEGRGDEEVWRICEGIEDGRLAHRWQSIEMVKGLGCV